jgi:NAD(P)-dependent dehydrogenase (short-subunit alcohol dehydrogenase family)
MAEQSKRPIPPFPAQKQEPPGLEEEMKPFPEYQGKEYKPSGKLEGKVALITGGDSGIGRAVALLFAREGANVAIVYLPAEERDAQVISQEIEKLGRTCLPISGDVTDSSFCKEAVEKTVQELGQLDILVNNAAAMLEDGSIDTVSDEDIEHLFRVNAFSYFYTVRAALKHMKRGSCIINTGSIVGSRGGEGMTVYAATKAANHTFTKSLAKELLSRGIRVNCVAPGPVWTPLQVAYKSEEVIVHFGAHNPMGRPGQPDELAPAFVFLASEADSSYMSGEIIFVTGGDVAR